MEILLLLAGMLLGAFLVYFYTQSQFARVSAELRHQNEQSEISRQKEAHWQKEYQQLQNSYTEAKEKLAGFQGAFEGLKHQISGLEQEKQQWKAEVNRYQQLQMEMSNELTNQKTSFAHLQEQLSAKKEEVIKLEERLKEAFQNLSNEILEKKGQKFTEMNRQHLQQVLEPLKEKIQLFEKQVQETYEKEARERFSLSDKIKELVLLNQQLGDEARNLTQALKGDSKVQGNWGEMILQRILEESGLMKDREYFIQESFTQADGKRLQPDVVIRYPGNKSVVIDSKVSLVAYERFVQSNDREVQQNMLKSHLQSVRSHIANLSGKDYQRMYQLNSLDYVILFVPIEPAFLLAIQSDPQLWKFAYDKKVLLISPTNLIAVLKIIHELWKVEHQNQNAIEIAERGGKLYDKFASFVETLQEVGKEIGKAQSKYQLAMKQLSEGNGNIIGQVEKLKELGVKAKKSIPEGSAEQRRLDFEE